MVYLIYIYEIATTLTSVTFARGGDTL